MHDYFRNHFGNWADPEIYELTRRNYYDRAHELGLALDDDPETWNEADYRQFERYAAEEGWI